MKDDDPSIGDDLSIIIIFITLTIWNFNYFDQIKNEWHVKEDVMAQVSFSWLT